MIQSACLFVHNNWVFSPVQSFIHDWLVSHPVDDWFSFSSGDDVMEELDPSQSV